MLACLLVVIIVIIVIIVIVIIIIGGLDRRAGDGEAGNEDYGQSQP